MNLIKDDNLPVKIEFKTFFKCPIITNIVDEPITCPHKVYDQKAMRKKLQKTSLSLIQDDEKKFKCHCAMDE